MGTIINRGLLVRYYGHMFISTIRLPSTLACATIHATGRAANHTHVTIIIRFTPVKRIQLNILVLQPGKTFVLSRHTFVE